MTKSFEDRLKFDGNVNEVVGRVMQSCGLGSVESADLITVGFEDYNIKVTTDSGLYLVKIFSAKRDDKEARRYVDVVRAALDSGVNHPKLYSDNNNDSFIVDKPSGLRMIVLDYIQGKTFYDSGGDFHAPDSGQLKLIAAEAVKINAMKIEPEYIFDSWAIPNMRWMYDKTKQHLSEEGDRLVNKAFERYDSIPLDELPKCFVHGDIIKTNVVMGDDGKAYIIDFAVSNTYPRIQELAVMSANLMFDGKTPLRERVDSITGLYLKEGGNLTDAEKNHVFDYALPGAAMEYMGSVWEKDVNGDTSEEIEYWAQLGLEGLREAIG
jgi:Ser/Thr protein kinase RdoA (MazF antagonist)